MAFMRTFVSDILDLNQLKHNVFSLLIAPFDVMSVLEEIREIFSLQANALNNNIVIQTTEFIPMPTPDQR